MMSIKIKNLDKFSEQLSHWTDKVEEQVMDTANGITVELFNTLLQESPQYSGDFVGNWQYQINGITPTFREINLLEETRKWEESGPYKRGSMPAITYAKAMNKGRDHTYQFGDTFYLHNSATHNEPYALKIEEGTINFRYEVGNSGQVVARSMAAVAPKYTTVGAGQARRLKRKKL